MPWSPDIDPNNEPFKILLKKGEFHDASRNRDVPYKIYFPVDHGLEKMPVIIWSHGFGGNRDGASFISRFVSSHGYVIVHLTHHGTDSSLWEGKDGHPWDILKNTKVPRATTLDRMYDVPFVLDQLSGWADENPDVGAHMDLENLGMSGHSFGAMTTQVMAGMVFPKNEKDELRSSDLVSLREDRFKAGILYSPVPIAHLSDALPSELYGPIAIPLFHMTGTEDDSPIEGFGYAHRLVVHEHSGHPEKYLQVLEGGDHMVYNGTRGKLAKNDLRDQHEEEIKLASLGYWDYHLKNDEKAKAWLEAQGYAH